MASEYGWPLEYIFSIPYHGLIGLVESIVERHRRELAEQVLVAHSSEPQKLYDELIGAKKDSGKSIKELIDQFVSAGIPVEVRRKSGRRS